MSVGRPPIFKTAEEMQKAIDAYFDRIEGDENQVVTVSGLAYEIGMTTATFRNYENKDEFFATVKRAKQRAEMHIEQLLLNGRQATGPIFNLKNNFGWKDEMKQEIGGDFKISTVERVIVDPKNSDS